MRLHPLEKLTRAHEQLVLAQIASPLKAYFALVRPVIRPGFQTRSRASSFHLADEAPFVRYYYPFDRLIHINVPLYSYPGAQV